MSGIDSNAAAAADRLRRANEAVRAELAGEMNNQAARIAVALKRNAPKGFSTLTDSIRVDPDQPLLKVIAPHTDYAKWVVGGRKPGKGLPRFFDPASAAVVAWLQARLQGARLAVNLKYRRGARGTARFTAEELELRDRYWMLSRAIKARGIKPNDFIKRTAQQFATSTPDALRAAVRRGLQQVQGGVA